MIRQTPSCASQQLENMDQDEDTIMRDPGSLAGISAPSELSTAATAATSSSSSAEIPARISLSSTSGNGLQPATLFGMPKLPSTLMSPTPLPATTDAPSVVSTELQGLPRSIEEESLPPMMMTMMMKSSEESDSVMEDNSDWSVDDTASTTVGLPVSSLATGLCYDIRMRYHCEVRPAAEVHPEDPRRIYYIYKEICRAGLVEDPDIVATPKPLAPIPLKRIAVRNATKEEVELVHTDEHYQFVSETQSMLLSFVFSPLSFFPLGFMRVEDKWLIWNRPSRRDSHHARRIARFHIFQSTHICLCATFSRRRHRDVFGRCYAQGQERYCCYSTARSSCRARQDDGVLSV